MSGCCTPPPFIPPESPAKAAAGRGLKTIALIGPPNSGKSTLFNRLTGLRQKVANYPGVTVEQRMGRMAGIGRDDLVLIDLPGIYSLDAYSEDARVSMEVLKGRMPGTPKPDAVLLVLDSLHLTRQLMLAARCWRLGLPTMVLLNMSDLMEDPGRSGRSFAAGAGAAGSGGARQRDQRDRAGVGPLFLNRQSGQQPRRS